MDRPSTVDPPRNVSPADSTAPSVADPYTPVVSRRRQMARALRTVARIERGSRLLTSGRRRVLTVHDWEAVDAGPHTAEMRRQTPSDETVGPRDGSPRPMKAATSANVVRLSKFSAADCVRARSFYFDIDVPLSMKLVVADRARQGPIISEIEARSALGGSTGVPAPPLLEWGGGRRHAYLVEPVVFGRHPQTHPERQQAAATLLPALLSAHRKAGVSDDTPTFHADTLSRLERLFRHLVWNDSWTHPERLLAVARELVTSQATLPVGWCHGDLVFSNIIVARSGELRVIDFEHAKVMPIATDLGTLIAASPDPYALVDLVEAAATPGDVGSRPGRHTVRDQLAVTYLRELSWWEPKQRRATATGRTANFISWATRRIELVGSLI